MSAVGCRGEALLVVVSAKRSSQAVSAARMEAGELLRGAADPLDLLDVDGLEQRLAGREVAIERADADIGAPGDALQRGVLALGR